MDLVSVVTALAAIDVATADRALISERLRLVTRLLRMAQAEEIACDLRLDELATADPSISPEQLHASATGRSLTAANRSMSRATAARALPLLRDAVASGDVSAEHLDAFSRSLRSLPKGLRPRLLELEPEFVRLAIVLTVEAFGDRLVAEVRRIEGDDGAGRLQHQRRHTALRTWTDAWGMVRMSGQWDPETGLALLEALRHQTEARFHGEHPPDAPDDPVLRHQYFQALALADLVLGGGSGAGRPEFIVTIDERTLREGRHEHSRVECGRGIHLPIAALQAMAGRARFVPVMLDRNGIVISMGRPVPSLDQLVDSLRTPVSLDHGRTRRHASRRQRRALRAMYRTCAIPGCDRHIGLTEPHHVEFWEHGGATDLASLLPLCKHHHDRLHADDWQVQLRDDRSLVVRRHGEVIMTTGPPSTQWA